MSVEGCGLPCGYDCNGACFDRTWNKLRTNSELPLAASTEMYVVPAAVITEAAREALKEMREKLSDEQLDKALDECYALNENLREQLRLNDEVWHALNRERFTRFAAKATTRTI